MSNLLLPLVKFLAEKGVSRGMPRELREIFYNGPDRYCARDADGIFTVYNKTHIKSRIAKVMPPGLSRSEAKAWVSESLFYIENERVVDFAGFTACYAPGIHLIPPSDFRMLVTRTNKPILPEPGSWDLMREFMTQLFGAEDGVQFQTICGWLAVFYGDMLRVLHLDRHAPWRHGQALALVGPPSAGKTLFGRVIQQFLGTTTGRPLDFATGRTQFNEELFESALWWIDDEATRDPSERGSLTARMKQFVAASDLRRHAKFMKPLSVVPRHRLLWCVNDQPDALSVLPKFADGVGDKIILLLVGKANLGLDLGKPEGRNAFWAQINKELPAFGYFLLEEFNLPVNLECGRFGVKTYHHPEVLESLSNLEYENRLLELIDVAFEGDCGLEATSEHRKPNGKSAKAWIGRSLALQHEITRFMGAHEARMLFPHGTSCGRYLGQLAKLYPDRVAQGPKLHGNLKWIVWPPDKGGVLEA